MGSERLFALRLFLPLQCLIYVKALSAIKLASTLWLLCLALLVTKETRKHK